MGGAKQQRDGGPPGNPGAPQTERDPLEEPSYHKDGRTKLGGRRWEPCRGLGSWETCKRTLRETTEPGSMLAGTALAPRAQRRLLQSTAHAEGIWAPQDLGSWGETQAGSVEFSLDF